MRCRVILSLLALCIFDGAQAAGPVPNYYSFDPPASQGVDHHSRTPDARAQQPVLKGFVTDDEYVKQLAVGTVSPHIDASSSSKIPVGDRVVLPPNMDKGVRDLEVGMDELRAYTGEMAAHIQQNGLRGFLAVPPEIKDKGAAVGRRIGSGIGGIMTDVGHDMLVPEKRSN